MEKEGRIGVEEAVKAQKALRKSAGLGEELFSLPAFVGMISDEVEALRSQGKTDDEIAALIRGNASIEISAQDIAEHYAGPEKRHDTHEH